MADLHDAPLIICNAVGIIRRLGQPWNSFSLMCVPMPGMAGLANRNHATMCDPAHHVLELDGGVVKVKRIAQAVISPIPNKGARPKPDIRRADCALQSQS